MQRTGVKFLRRMALIGIAIFAGIGKRAYFLVNALASMWREPRTYFPLIIRQMRSIGVDSLVLTGIVAAFIGSVIALQTRYQLFPGVQLSVVGLIVRQSIVLELGPLLTGLVLTGRVGARMTAEIGTMRVTEQIDALESLGRSPVTHLLLPRILAGVIAIPALVMLANAFGIIVGYITAQSSLGLTYADFEFGARYFFRPLDLWYSLVKSYAFAGAVTIIPCYIGFNTQQGAEGVGRATTQAVVASSVTVLFLDTILTKLILGTAK